MSLQKKFLVHTTIAMALAAMTSACGAPKSNTAASESAPVSTWEPPPLPTDGAIGVLGVTGPDDKPWAAMNEEEKKWYMIGKVHPIMRQVFQTYDHSRYEGLKFECTPCHESEENYRMPNAKLSVIPPVGSEDWKAMENARVFKFMKQRVTPVMAKLLGHDPDDASLGDAVSCHACHPKS